VRALSSVVFVACASSACAPAPRPLAPVADAPVEVPAARERHYAIWLGGARVGTASESETWSHAGVVLRRTETLQFLRGTTPVALITTIAITADAALVPSRIVWSEHGSTPREAIAVRDERGWTITAGDPRRGELARLPPDVIPAELVPLHVRRDGRFAGRVFLPARGFLVGSGRVEPAAPGRLVARLALDGGARAEATIDLADDGDYARVVDGEGVIARRTTAAQAMTPFPPVDLIAATAIPIAGHGARLVIDGNIALPPVPGQAARLAADGIELALATELPGAMPDDVRGPDRSADIRAIVDTVRAHVVPDLGTGPATAAQAAHATAGDCTTFALAYAAHAARHAIPTRVVTGLRVDGDRLIRHRWAVSWTGRAWIAVDAAFGAVPAGGDLIGLAVHDADDAGLVAGEAALTMVTSASRR